MSHLPTVPFLLPGSHLHPRVNAQKRGRGKSCLSASTQLGAEGLCGCMETFGITSRAPANPARRSSFFSFLPSFCSREQVGGIASWGREAASPSGAQRGRLQGLPLRFRGRARLFRGYGNAALGLQCQGNVSTPRGKPDSASFKEDYARAGWIPCFYPVQRSRHARAIDAQRGSTRG